MTRRWLLAFTVVITMFAFSSRARSLLSSASSVVVYPFAATASSIGSTMRGWSKVLESKASLRSRCATLERRLEILRAEHVVLAAATREYNLTHELATFQRRFAGPHVQRARIIAKTLSPTKQTMLIDKGSRDGVERDAIIFHAFHLLGRVMKVFPWYSQVLVITDARSRVPVAVGTNAEGIAEGTNDEHSMMVRYISRDMPVSDGEVMLTSGQGLVFPEGLGCGSVQDVKRAREYHEITVSLPIDLRGLSHCLVARRGEEPIA